MENQIITYDGAGNRGKRFINLKPQEQLQIYVKECKKCVTVKPGKEFYPHQTNADRLEGKCRECRDQEDKARKEAKRQKTEWFIFD